VPIFVSDELDFPAPARPLPLPPPRPDPPFAAPLARAALAIGRLDQALTGNPLAPAILYRARLDAVRRMAAIDGQAIDPWRFAALLAGLRLRMDSSLSMRERGRIVDAARSALDLYQWLVKPDFDQEGEVQQAEKAIGAGDGVAPLLAAGRGFHAWLERGGSRPPARAALIRCWRRHQLCHVFYPLTGAAALSADTPWAPADWLPQFLYALAREAEDGLQLASTLEREWRAARCAVGGRRRNSRAGAAIDILAAAPIVSAKTLSEALAMAPKNAGQLLEAFAADGLVVEVSHRTRHRLYGLAALAPLRDAATEPRRPLPGRGPGRPSRPSALVDDDAPAELPPVPYATPIDRDPIDYSGLDAAMAQIDDAMRKAREALAALGSRLDSRGLAGQRLDGIAPGALDIGMPLESLDLRLD
jgi:hypothetical protein